MVYNITKSAQIDHYDLKVDGIVYTVILTFDVITDKIVINIYLDDKEVDIQSLPFKLQGAIHNLI